MYSRFGSTWRSVQIGDLIRTGALVIGDGYRVTNVELGESGTPFVRGGDIRDGRVFTDVADHIRPEFEERISGKLSQPEDVVFITKGTVGRVGYLRSGQPQVVFAPQVCYWRVIDRKVLHPRFVFYLLQGREFQANLEAVKTHGSMLADYVSLSDQRRFRLTLPPIDVQENIADTIGALDDKVEINRQVNQTLEAVARATFESWFVDFEPSPDEVPCKSEPVPLGALVKQSKDLLNPADSSNEMFDHFSLPAFDDGRCPKLEKGEDIKSNKFLVPAGAVLLSKLNPRIPRVWMPALSSERRSICSTEFLPLLPTEQEEDREYLYALFCSAEFLDALVSRATGTSGSHQRVRPDDLLRISLYAPERAARKHYSEVVRPLFERVALNLEESRTLAALRDALLPKLLSGEIRVKQAEKIVGEAV